MSQNCKEKHSTTIQQGVLLKIGYVWSQQPRVADVRELKFCSKTEAFPAHNFRLQTVLFEFGNVRKPRFGCKQVFRYKLHTSIASIFSTFSNENEEGFNPTKFYLSAAQNCIFFKLGRVILA